jgi:hypothetical protein
MKRIHNSPQRNIPVTMIEGHQWLSHILRTTIRLVEDLFRMLRAKIGTTTIVLIARPALIAEDYAQSL